MRILSGIWLELLLLSTDTTVYVYSDNKYCTIPSCIYTDFADSNFANLTPGLPPYYHPRYYPTTFDSTEYPSMYPMMPGVD